MNAPRMVPVSPVTDAESTADAALRPRWFGVRWPLWFQAPREPLTSAPIAYDEGTTPTRFTWRVIAAAWSYTVPATLLLIVGQVAAAMLPVIAGLAIDRSIATGDPGALVWWLAVLLADIAVMSMGFRFGSRMGFFGMQTVQHRLRTQVTDRLLHPAGMADRRLDGAMLSIATSDVLRLAASRQLSLYPVGDLAAVVACGVGLLVIDVALGVAVLVAAPVLLWVMTIAGRPLQRRSAQQQVLVAAATGQGSDLVAGYRIIKGVRAEAEAAARYRVASRTALQSALAARTTRGLYVGSMNIVTGLFIAGLTIAAAALALAGRISVGELIAAVGLMQFLITPLTALPAGVGAVWAVAIASARRVLDLLRTPYAVPPGSVAVPPRALPAPATAPPRIALDDPALGGASGIVVRPGECVGMRLDGVRARRLVDALALGRGIRLDDVPGDGLPVEDYRTRVLVAPHSADLFDGSIADNLVSPGYDDGRVLEALHAAACDDILDVLPDGIRSHVGEGGTRLSGGQRQRIALARAYAADPPVLVLHDPTTAVDSVTEAAIAERLRAMRAGRSTLLITGSGALLSVCDRVVADEAVRA
ncbi:ABC transporter transmembrane domain-containing protein [Microbacterium sp. No. 7]|uniref:ABC transporter transmembrane domain-containing protein n=1 Tax=Microbacterium sp. No. 7 TaxID=1714373 RepID=UPI0006ED49A8|nr:ABC transporter ATP-binding protein [Microbacterium sp. No. 7]ALJ20076.1 hypothetical protein AOA12_09200 [Microbacterium sp. No. 7]